MVSAQLEVVNTSSTCVRYTLTADGKRIWSNRVDPTKAGHAGARERMAAWALQHRVEVKEEQNRGPPAP